MIYKENEEAIKSVKDRVIHGVGIRFGSPDTKDWDGEFFTSESEVGLIDGANRPFLMEHGFSKNFGVNKVADAVFEKTQTGWEYEATFLDNDFGIKAFGEITTHAYRSSAGAAGHTRRATLIKGAYHLDTFMIGEQSATLTPADPHNARVTRTKSDYMLMAIREMIQDMHDANEEKIKCVLTAVQKDTNDARQKLADALMSLKESFTSGEKFVVNDDVLAAFDLLSQPIEIINLG